MRSQEIERPIMVAFVLKHHEVVFPESLIVAVGNEGALVDGGQKIVIS